MVSQKEKQQTTQFICDRLEDSGLYVVQRRELGHLLVKEKNDVEKPKTIDVIIPNFLGPVKNYTKAFRQNAINIIYTAPVLHKDGETAFVRMVDTNMSWRTDKSLKRYSPEEINRMLHLRKIEKEVLVSFDNPLTYYQPETDRLPQSLRQFKLTPVLLDYSHIGPEHHGYDFVEDRESIDYKLPQGSECITSAVRFNYYKYDPLRARIIAADYDGGVPVKVAPKGPKWTLR
ncbi:hypothetical protein J4228_01790 [Candidatus Woesearchaeota archaeon]|nr:hypothetical protein [Candidatus Woesearchaeota archaeon]